MARLPLVLLSSLSGIAAQISKYHMKFRVHDHVPAENDYLYAEVGGSKEVMKVTAVDGTAKEVTVERAKFGSTRVGPIPADTELQMYKADGAATTLAQDQSEATKAKLTSGGAADDIFLFQKTGEPENGEVVKLTGSDFSSAEGDIERTQLGTSSDEANFLFPNGSPAQKLVKQTDHPKAITATAASDAATTMTLDDTGYQADNAAVDLSLLVSSAEIVKVTAVDDKTLTVTREHEGTAKQAHFVGASVEKVTFENVQGNSTDSTLKEFTDSAVELEYLANATDPGVGTLIKVGSEIMRVAKYVDPMIHVERGYLGTTEAAGSEGATLQKLVLTGTNKLAAADDVTTTTTTTTAAETTTTTADSTTADSEATTTKAFAVAPFSSGLIALVCMLA